MGDVRYSGTGEPGMIPRTDRRLDEMTALTKKIVAGDVTPKTIHDLVWQGLCVYQQGVGLPIEQVKAAIAKGFEEVQ